MSPPLTSSKPKTLEWKTAVLPDSPLHIQYMGSAHYMWNAVTPPATALIGNAAYLVW